MVFFNPEPVVSALGIFFNCFDTLIPQLFDATVKF